MFNRRITDYKQTFSIRKYSVGTVSTLLGFFALLGVDSKQVNASELKDVNAKLTEVSAVETISTSKLPLENLDVPKEVVKNEVIQPVVLEVAEEGASVETSEATKEEKTQEVTVEEVKIGEEAVVTPEASARNAAPTEEELHQEEATKPMMVFSLDAGRKYFTPESLKTTITNVADLGYTDFHLLVGNNGLRFLLDDMSLEVNGQTYESDAVKEAIKNGNRKYEASQNYTGVDGAVLTQSEMDDITAHAESKNLRFIATINSPGHMNAILSAIGELGVANAAFTNNGKESAGTVDLNNEQAVGITKALVDKYAAYFADKSEIFNIGLDEYANDSTRPKLGFKILQEKGEYNKFVNYANDLAAIVKKHGLRPMAFNDGIYHANVVDQGTFDKDIIVSYWTLGFPVEEAGETAQYVVANPKLLKEKGHDIINTNDDWYYIIGRDNANSGWYNLDQGKGGIGRSAYDKLQGAEKGEIPVLGAMLAVWADNPANEYREELVKELAETFANRNGEYFKADYKKLNDLVKILDQNPDKKVEAQKILDTIVWDKTRNEQEKVEEYVRQIQRLLGKEAPIDLRDLRVFSLDAGRKYFDKDTIKKIVDEISALGFTDLHLLLGNDGFRFLLDDMEITAGGITYSSDQVKEAIRLGNTQYYNDPNGNYLTQAELDEISAYAKSKNIGLIPTINSPGHMTALINAMYNLGIQYPEYYEQYSQILSKGTVDLTNQTAVEFTKNLVKKYVTYFADKAEIFNIGLDEYANDATNARGFEYLQSDGLYDEFIAYANDLAAFIKEKGLRPMAFSDGVYYDNRTDLGTFDKDILLSYWTSGWWGYYPAKASLLEEKGHKIINTNDKWYNIIGNNDAGNYNYVNSLKNIAETPYKQVAGNADGLIDTIGSILAIWADTPSATFEYEKFQEMAKLFAKTNAAYFPADNTDLKNKVEEAKTIDKTVYTEESLVKIEELLNSINWYEGADKQEEINKKLSDLTELIKNLEYKKADYTKLDELKANLPTDLENYWEPNKGELAEILSQIDENLTILDQAKVDEYVEKLEQASAKLIKIEQEIPSDYPTEETKPEIVIESKKGEGLVQEAKPEITIETSKGSSLTEKVKPEIVIESKKGEGLVQEVKPEITIEISKGSSLIEEVKPEIVIESKKGEGLVQEAKPSYPEWKLLNLTAEKPEITIESKKGEGLVQEAKPSYPEWKLLNLTAEKPEITIESKKGEGLVQEAKPSYPEWKLLNLTAEKPEIVIESKKGEGLVQGAKSEITIETSKVRFQTEKVKQNYPEWKQVSKKGDRVLPKTSAGLTNYSTTLPIGLVSVLFAAGLLVRRKEK
ncbi:MAG: family 20 glycosylhydrolase [Gemella sp.]|nr:family 20 glycosylhydrolase [Gemella sp.]